MEITSPYKYPSRTLNRDRPRVVLGGFDAVQRGDLEGTRALNDRLDPLVRVFYAPPFLDMHNRMKEALVLLGRISRATVRPPLQAVPDAERKAIRQALAASGLLEAGAKRSA